MATILELGCKEGDVFQPLSSEYYTPIYYTDWEIDSKKSIIYNKERIKFNVNVDEDKTINCLSINILKHNVMFDGDSILFAEYGEDGYDLFSHKENEVIFSKADLQINVS